MEGAVHGRGSLSAEGAVIRALNETRLALLGILVGIALTVGFGAPGPWWSGVLFVFASFAFSALLLRWERSRSASRNTRRGRFGALPFGTQSGTHLSGFEGT